MNPDYRSAFDHEFREIRLELEQLMQRQIDEAGGGDGRDPKLEMIVRWLDLLTRRTAAQERRSMELSRRINGIDESVRLVCEVLRQLDDPYGFGESLDARIAAESLPTPPDESY